jgi:DNA-binding transcriptional MerR regulator
MAGPLTVGEFARITHLSVKTLRHYHQVGLLEPAQVNPDTGYRYYSVAQVPTVQVIRRLRDLEMPVADVKAVLAAPDAPARNVLIAAHLNRLEAQLAQTYAAVDSLRSLLEGPGGASAVTHRTVQAAAAVGIRQTVDREDILAWWQGALGELHATARAQGLRPTGPGGGLYASELFTRDRGEATVFLPIETGHPAAGDRPVGRDRGASGDRAAGGDLRAGGQPRAVGRVVPLVVPAAELAVATHRGSLRDIDVTYGQLGSYVTTHEIGVDGPLREYYLAGAQDTPDEVQWRTEIAWPIFRAS